MNMQSVSRVACSPFGILSNGCPYRKSNPLVAY